MTVRKILKEETGKEKIIEANVLPQKTITKILKSITTVK